MEVGGLYPKALCGLLDYKVCTKSQKVERAKSQERWPSLRSIQVLLYCNRKDTRLFTRRQGCYKG